MKILLLGGTGVIGKYLSQKYNENGTDVYVTSRSSHPDCGSVHYIKGNAMDDEFLHYVCNIHQWDAIVDFMSYKTKTFASRVDILLSSTKQYVFISTARVYGNMEHPIKETSPRLLECSTDKHYLGTDEYALTKARQEDILKKSKNNNYTIVRPCITYGPERLQLGVLEKEQWLYRALKGRTVVFCKEIADRITTMTIGEDICKGLFSIIGNENAIGDTIHLTSNYHRTWNEIWTIYSNTMESVCGFKPKLKMVSLSEFLSTRSPDLKYQVIYDRVYDRNYNVDKENLYVDLEQFTPPEKGLDNCLRLMIRNGRFKRINWKYEAKRDKLTGELTPISEIEGINSKIKYLINRFL